jgi:5-(aminomethyl)-3-furanmethanol phosphate kinase
MSNTVSLRVVKVGGSLLELPDLADRLRDWLGRQAPAQSLFIAGGGPFVDELRAMDSLHAVGDEACHWLAIRAMSLTARLLGALVPEWRLIGSWRELADFAGSPADRPAADEQAAGERAAILDPLEFLEADEAFGDPLPHIWHVTSDSIAARVASRLVERLPASVELVLLKSSLPPAGCDTQQAAACGYVDAHFPSAARGLNVCCIDLRASEYPRRPL